jgi:hypothetical protein
LRTNKKNKKPQSMRAFFLYLPRTHKSFCNLSLSMSRILKRVVLFKVHLIKKMNVNLAVGSTQAPRVTSGSTHQVCSIVNKILRDSLTPGEGISLISLLKYH